MTKQSFNRINIKIPSDLADNASLVLELFQDRTNSTDETIVADLLTDLMHWCAHHHRDFDSDLDHARIHFEAEHREASHANTSAFLTRCDLGTFAGVRPSPEVVELDDLDPSLDLDHWFEERELERTFTAWEVLERGSCPGIEFRPAGDHPGVTLVFEGSEFVNPQDLRALIRLLQDLGGDSPANFLNIHHASHATGQPLHLLQVEQIHALDCSFYSGSDVDALRQQAEGEVLARFGSAARRTWDREMADAGPFETGSILESPDLWVADLMLGTASALLVALKGRTERST